MKETIVRTNGVSDAALPVDDRALHFGDGLFETMRVACGRPEHLERHLLRLEAGCARLQLAGLDWHELRRDITDLAAGRDSAVLKVIVTRGAGARGYRFDPEQEPNRMLMLSPMPSWPRRNRESGVRLTVCHTRLCAQPLLAGIKHLNRLEQVMAASEWRDPEIAEGLVLDRQGRLVEGTRTNVFLVHNDTLVTPALKSCGVAGIMRSVILDLAKQLDLATEVRAATLAEARRARELFVCNSLIRIWPVNGIEGVADYKVGHVTRTLIESLENCPQSGGDHWYPS